MVRSVWGLGTLWGVEEWGELNGEHEAKKEGKQRLGQNGLVKSGKVAENNQMKWIEANILSCSNIIPTESTNIWYLSN